MAGTRITEIYYARFDHPDKTYVVWAKKHKSGWGVHRLYLPKHIGEFKLEAPFWELDWSSCDYDRMDKDEMLCIFNKICQIRFRHEYLLVASGRIIGTKVQPYPITREEK